MSSTPAISDAPTLSRENHVVAVGLNCNQPVEFLRNRLLTTQSREVRLEAGHARVGVGIVLNVILGHEFRGPIQPAASKNNSEEIVGELFVGGELRVA